MEILRLLISFIDNRFITDLEFEHVIRLIGQPIIIILSTTETNAEFTKNKINISLGDFDRVWTSNSSNPPRGWSLKSVNRFLHSTSSSVIHEINYNVRGVRNYSLIGSSRRRRVVLEANTARRLVSVGWDYNHFDPIVYDRNGPERQSRTRNWYWRSIRLSFATRVGRTRAHIIVVSQYTRGVTAHDGRRRWIRRQRQNRNRRPVRGGATWFGRAVRDAASVHHRSTGRTVVVLVHAATGTLESVRQTVPERLAAVSHRRRVVRENKGSSQDATDTDAAAHDRRRRWRGCRRRSRSYIA